MALCPTPAGEHVLYSEDDIVPDADDETDSTGPVDFACWEAASNEAIATLSRNPDGTRIAGDLLRPVRALEN